VIAEVFAHTRTICDDGNTKTVELIRWANAGQEKHVRRADSTGAQHDLGAFDNKRFAAAFDLDAGGLRAIEQEPSHQAVGLNGQIETMPGLAQVAECRAVADAVGVIKGGGANAGGVGVIVVGAIREASGQARLVKGHLTWQPRLARKPMGDDRAVVAMDLVVEILVVFQRAKVG
jgi:hypothetical protein